MTGDVITTDADLIGLMACADEWQRRAYRDVDGRRLPWRNPIDRLAVFLYATRYMTPEAAGSACVGEYDELGKTWKALQDVDRQLWRRRAAIAVTLLGGAVVTVQADERRPDGSFV